MVSGSDKKPASYTTKFLAFSASLPFAANSFGANTHTAPEHFTEEWYDKLSSLDLFLAFTNAACALGINTINNVETFPDAFEQVKKRKTNFRKNKLENAFIFIFASLAAIAAGTIGYYSFSFLGGFLAGTVSLLFGTVMLGTRIFGITNLITKYRQYKEDQKAEEYIDKLNRLKEEHLSKIQTILDRQTTLDDSAVQEVLNELDKIIRETPEENACLNQKTSTAYFRTCLDVLQFAVNIFAIVGTLAIAPVFAQKLFDGIRMMAGYSVNDPNSYTTSLTLLIGCLCLLGSIATPILYLVSLSCLAETLYNTYKHIADPKLDFKDKTWNFFKAICLLATNYCAALGTYNLTESSPKQADYLYGSTLPAPNTSTAETHKYLAMAAAGGVNLKFTYNYCFKPEEKSPTPVERTKEGVIEYLKTRKSRKSQLFTQAPLNTPVEELLPSTPRQLS